MPIPKAASDASAIHLGRVLPIAARGIRLRDRRPPFRQFAGAVAANHAAHERNDSQYQQNVNEPSHRVRCSHTRNPKNEKHDAH